jgi:hypothetical protein
MCGIFRIQVAQNVLSHSLHGERKRSLEHNLTADLHLQLNMGWATTIAELYTY